MTKVPTPTEKYKKNQRDTKSHQNVDYKTIAERLGTLSLSNDSKPTDVVKPV